MNKPNYTPVKGFDVDEQILFMLDRYRLQEQPSGTQLQLDLNRIRFTPAGGRADFEGLITPKGVELFDWFAQVVGETYAKSITPTGITYHFQQKMTGAFAPSESAIFKRFAETPMEFVKLEEGCMTFRAETAEHWEICGEIMLDEEMLEDFAYHRDTPIKFGGADAYGFVNRYVKNECGDFVYGPTYSPGTVRWIGR